MPHLPLPHIPDPTMESLVVVVLVVAVIAPIVGSVLVLIFGDRSKSPLDRWATWVAKNTEGAEGDPIVKSGKEPTQEQKFWTVAYFLAVYAVIAWFLLR